MDWVITVMSSDRAGIVEDIAAIITSHEGNWVKSSMSRLGGQFAGIVQFTTPNNKPTANTSSEAPTTEASIEDLKADLQALSTKGIIIQLQHEQKAKAPEGQKATIELTGLDHKGIVSEITRLLAEKRVTIEQFETDIFIASMSGEAMFTAKAEIILPQELSMTQLTAATEEIAEDIMVDINLQIDQSV